MDECCHHVLRAALLLWLSGPPSSLSDTSRRYCFPKGPCPVRNLAQDAWLDALLTSSDLSKPKQWIWLRLQLGPPYPKRHLTYSKCLEISIIPTPCPSKVTPWWLLHS